MKNKTTLACVCQRLVDRNIQTRGKKGDAVIGVSKEAFDYRSVLSPLGVFVCVSLQSGMKVGCVVCKSIFMRKREIKCAWWERGGELSKACEFYKCLSVFP